MSEKALTPMQEHLEWLKREWRKLESTSVLGFALLHIEDCIKHAESMLEKEKEVMNETWDSAVDDLEEFETFEDFYNETFNTNSK